MMMIMMIKSRLKCDNDKMTMMTIKMMMRMRMRSIVLLPSNADPISYETLGRNHTYFRLNECWHIYNTSFRTGCSLLKLFSNKQLPG
mmetsp:Transcript_10329/g.16576  ORF Transcript_10329/g.16576 Transcript_10329/m.16576 type:complete len:87 (+) Transcript_10329:37-297(+)